MSKDLQSRTQGKFTDTCYKLFEYLVIGKEISSRCL